MPARKVSPPSEIYQLKITLIGARPPIWRRLLMPSDMTLEHLHYAIQTAVGWEESHLHEFRIGRRRFGAADPEDDCENEAKVRLADVLGGKGAKLEYTYDFGDGWDHSIVVEQVLPRDPEGVYPICTGGKRHGPPEDCGGVGGYENLLEAIADPGHEEHEESLEWLGEGFDPEEFSVEEVNRYLKPLQGKKTRKAKAES